jgi:hypothetical protein
MNPNPVSVDPNGDVDLLIGIWIFRVSSSQMSAISPEFRKVFGTENSSLLRTIELPYEDPFAFFEICKSAHGIFTPRTHISLDILVKMANAIRRYRIPVTSSIYHAVESCFQEWIPKLETIPTRNLTTFLQVAKDLGSSVSIQLLELIFILDSFHIETLPIESELNYLTIKGAACRARIVKTLFSPTTKALYQKRNYRLVTWILADGPSLRNIDSQLKQEIQDFYSDELPEARRAIEESLAEVCSYFRRTADAKSMRKEENLQQEVAGLRHHLTVKRLEVQIAHDEQDTRALSPASSTSTEFEDIDAYAGSVAAKFDPFVQSSENESLRSFRTV